MIRRIAATVALCGALAACGSTATDVPDADVAASEEYGVDWTSSYDAGVVQVEFVDPAARYRFETVDLVSPTGVSYPAAEITREIVTDDGAGGLRPTVGVGGGYNSYFGSGVGLGVGLSFPLGGHREEETAQRTRARLVVPDPEQYRRTVEHWEIVASLSTPEGEERYIRIAAPVPEKLQ